MKSIILSDKAIREIILSLRSTSFNRTRESEREYMRRLIAKIEQHALEKSPIKKKGKRK